MNQSTDTEHLTNLLKTAVGLLKLESKSPLLTEVNLVCEYLKNPNFRIAVFGPFNYGKSTLLNALLGNRALPIDLIPTTGAAIHVRYGDELKTTITLKDGQKITDPGTKVLKEFAILDQNRRMRDDVRQVEVFCPDSFLKTGVELLDLPGTNDREAQDELVYQQLVTADLVVQVLDARQLMTLKERENLRDWLIERGIETVIFVVNFINLLDPSDQKEVQNRLRFVAESFRVKLPNNISNLYRVDALPALRAKLKGDTSAVQTTGLAMFESALQSLVSLQQEQTIIHVPRVQKTVNHIQKALTEQIETIYTQLGATQQKEQAKAEIQNKAKTLIQQGFQSSSSEFQSWLYLPKLLDRYQADIVTALKQGEFKSWETEVFKPTVLKYQEKILEWVNKACEFFDREHPGEFVICYPETPQVSVPPPSPPPQFPNSSGSATPTVIATGVGWMLGGPVGAAVAGGATHFLSKTLNSEQSTEVTTSNSNQVHQVYANLAQDYLTNFSTEGFSTLHQYEKKFQSWIHFPSLKESSENTDLYHQLQLFNKIFNHLNQVLE
ncbi:MAG: dynamin family protein [Limnoraphis sp. WC205]|jgi:ribosome biogenesis GTPase A|nr:dynamin family protein [Limnoraphis sp. WC205]